MAVFGRFKQSAFRKILKRQNTRPEKNIRMDTETLVVLEPGRRGSTAEVEEVEETAASRELTVPCGHVKEQTRHGTAVSRRVDISAPCLSRVHGGDVSRRAPYSWRNSPNSFLCQATSTLAVSLKSHRSVLNVSNGLWLLI